MKKKWAFRVLFYLIGLAVLALGILLNTKTALGVSPIISTAYCGSVLTESNFSNATFVLYCVLVLTEIVIHLIRREYKKIAFDALQIPMSFVFSRFMNLFDTLIPHFTNDLEGTVFATIPVRIAFLFLAIVLTGIGAALSLNARLIPNPGDGIVQAISDCTGKTTGFTKNCVDITCVILSCSMGLIVRHRLVGIGIGTILAMIGVGRVIWLFNKLTMAKIAALSGVEVKAKK